MNRAPLTQFAAETTEKKDILSALGIDWTLLILQLVAFLLLVWLLAKFVYPVFMRIIDERQAKIDAGTKAALEAEKKAAAAEADVEILLKKARDDAHTIVATARDEAATTLEAADKKAKERAEAIAASAREEIGKEVASAKKALRNETLDLIAQATEKVTRGSVSTSVDKKLVKQSLEEAET